MNLVLEILAVGILTGGVGLIVSTVLMFLLIENFTIKKYHFWWQVFLGYFITGCLIHIICEIFLVNKWYCKNGFACTS